MNLLEGSGLPRQETLKVGHALLQDSRFFYLLLQIDIELTAQSH